LRGSRGAEDRVTALAVHAATRRRKEVLRAGVGALVAADWSRGLVEIPITDAVPLIRARRDVVREQRRVGTKPALSSYFQNSKSWLTPSNTTAEISSISASEPGSNTTTSSSAE
ncbi:hypothetical protein LCGC14_2937240, partial [marine sediment metagenome]